MMSGWTGEPPEAERQAMPTTALLLANRERGPGDALAIAAARGRAVEAREARAEAAAAVDPDERAAALVARGIMPGMTSDLAQRLGDTLAELQAEQEKIERGQRRAEHVARSHAHGQITAFDIARMDLDEGDPGKVAALERRAEGLRRQVREASALMSPQREQAADPLEAASRRAHEVFREITRQRMAEAQAGRPAPRQARPPFTGRGGAAVRSETVTCADCVDVGATPEQSYLIHADPDAPATVRLPTAELTEADLAEFGRQAGTPYRSAPGQASRSYAESPRCSDCGYVRCQCGVAGAYVPVRPGTPFGNYS